jgi:hypothetical protein
VAAAKQNNVVAFDNLSGIRVEIADEICRLATGGGIGGRRLYTDADEAVFQARRPVVLNGIPELATRADLADRSIVLTLPRIPLEQRQSERRLNAAFHKARARIVAHLFDAVASGLACLPKIECLVKRKSVNLPRMADFAVWGMAVAPALGWTSDEFLAAFNANRKGAAETVLEADPVAAALIGLISEVGTWSGTATELLGELVKRSGDRTSLPNWPRSPTHLGSILRRLAPALEGRGISVSWERKSTERRLFINGPKG